MASAEIRRISADETHMLRHQILRPHQLPEELVFPGDDEPDSLHVGAFVEEALAGIASVVRSPMPDEGCETAWQLRGMAIRSELRRKGLGAAMVRACVDHVAKQGGTILWCRARRTAIPFYRALGFETRGDQFELPHTGPHIVMWRSVERPRKGASSEHETGRRT